MTVQEIATAFTIGLLATSSPCVLPLYPGFLAFLSTQANWNHKRETLAVGISCSGWRDEHDAGLRRGDFLAFCFPRINAWHPDSTRGFRLNSFWPAASLQCKSVQAHAAMDSSGDEKSIYGSLSLWIVIWSA